MTKRLLPYDNDYFSSTDEALFFFEKCHNLIRTHKSLRREVKYFFFEYPCSFANGNCYLYLALLPVMRNLVLLQLRLTTFRHSTSSLSAIPRCVLKVFPHQVKLKSPILVKLVYSQVTLICSIEVTLKVHRQHSNPFCRTEFAADVE